MSSRANQSHDHIKSLNELVLKKDKLRSFKPKFKLRGNGRGDKSKPTKNGIGLEKRGVDVCRHHYGRQKIDTLITTSASKFFIPEDTAQKLDLKVEKEVRWIKTMNSNKVPTMGVEKEVKLQLGDWTGKETIELIPLDDYDIVVGLSFLDQINALLIPFIDYMCVMDSHQQCLVPMKRDSGVEAKKLLAIQFVKGYVKMKYPT
ncbi:hypothetical protein J1N35_040661 [Gossypium stocksii]|uniref:Aspartic peptidase DDI1-type domain-containing protein n=1 Tax=Gossypium stocksii TaxID=47602 RepID=A0A9D3UEL7_9ROSI|nr:hypothetical protein J1N35_040661 [Gossypium stocksii]